MSSTTSPSEELKSYSVWDKTTRWFHWINVISIIGLIGVGIVILNNKALAVSGDGKILLKTVHVYIGYIFAANLGWRIIWGFLGNKYSRWTAVLPINKGYWQSLSKYIASARAGDPQTYLGHNPLAKLMIALLFMLLTAQAVTGLVLAGTDVFMPPFGNNIAEWVAEKDPEGNAVAIQAGSKDGVNKEAYAEMRDFRKPFITVHYYAFYILLLAAMVHILFVVVGEVKERNGLVSAMFTGKKVASKEPVDLD
ncbi:MAG: cytochrome b/b6 domain-containing protein [Gammaproteobacteria bacterium]|nr:cytochrome b/b6 domain-containing protein [Gammaproteobacteria bacterium]